MTTPPDPDPSDDPPPVSPPAAAAARAPRSRLIAVLLAAVIPGAGHLYVRRPVVGLVWMAAALAAYATFFLPGLVVHALCVVHTAVTRQQ